MKRRTRAAEANKRRSCGLFAAFALVWPVAAMPVGVGDTLRFPGDGGLREVEICRQAAPGRFMGSLDGYGGSLNATVEETADGWVMGVDDWRTRRVWRVARLPDGSIDVSVQAKQRGESCRRCAVCPVPAEATVTDGRLHRKNTLPHMTAGWPDDPVTNEIDILVVFDKTALSWLDKKRRTATGFAGEQIDKMNLALANSGLDKDFKVSLRGVFAAGFDVTRDCGYMPRAVLVQAVKNVAMDEGEKWAQVRAERDRLGADIVMVLADSRPNIPIERFDGVCGISFGLESEYGGGNGFPSKNWLDLGREAAYGVCDIRIVELDNTFGHEVGHLMGAGHSEILSPFYSEPGPQLFPYSCAMMFLDPVDYNYYYTIMGYNSADGQSNSPEYDEIPYYSSPALTHPATGTPLGDDSHDNVRTLRETCLLVSQYRVRTAAGSGGGPENLAIPDAWKRARTLTGKVFRLSSTEKTAEGVAALKCGKANRKGLAKVTVTLTGMDGKKMISYKPYSVDVRGDGNVAFNVGTGDTAMKVTISGNAFSGEQSSAGGWGIVSGSIGGALSSASPRVSVPSCDFAPAGGEVLAAYLPTSGEPISIKNGKWSFSKAVNVKYRRDGATGEYVVTDDLDESKGRANRSGMKLSYTAKTGFFKGSFKIYALMDGSGGKKRLKKFTVGVSGIVVDGAGRGQAFVKKPQAGPWPVEVK